MDKNKLGDVAMFSRLGKLFREKILRVDKVQHVICTPTQKFDIEKSLLIKGHESQTPSDDIQFTNFLSYSQSSGRKTPEQLSKKKELGLMKINSNFRKKKSVNPKGLGRSASFKSTKRFAADFQLVIL